MEIIIKLLELRGLFILKLDDGRYLVRNDFGMPGNKCVIHGDLCEALRLLLIGSDGSGSKMPEN